MIVCVCKAISSSRLRQIILSGAGDLPEVERRCGAGGSCGSCREEIEATIREVSVEDEQRCQRACG